MSGRVGEGVCGWKSCHNTRALSRVATQPSLHKKQSSLHCKPPLAIMAPNCWQTCYEVLETSFRAKICTNFPKICTSCPNICTNCPKIFTNFSKRCLKNIVISSWKKGSLGRGRSGTSAQSFVLCFSVLWGDFLLQISQKFLSEIASLMQAFSGKHPREKPQNAAADVTRFLNNFRIYGTPPSPGVDNDTKINTNH